MSRAAVIVPSLGAPSLQACLDALNDQGAAQIVVVCSGAASPPAPRAGVEVVECARRLGFAAAVERGLTEVRPEVRRIALVNDDATPQEGWLATLEAALEEDPELVAVQGTVTDGGGLAVDGRGIALDRWGLPVQLDHGLRAGTEDGPPRPVLAVSATAALFDRAALDAVRLPGGAVLDPRFGAYHEDLDLGLRLLRAGGRAAWVPGARCHHLGSTTGAGFPWHHPWWLLANRWRALAGNLDARSLIAALPRLARGEVRAVRTLARTNPRALVVAKAVIVALPWLIAAGLARGSVGPRLDSLPWGDS